MTVGTRAGVVYLLKANGQEVYKVGLTRNWLRRSRELRVGEKTTALLQVTVENPEACEKSIHARFDAQRLPQSEWFWLSQSQLGWVREYLADAAAKHAKPQRMAVKHDRYDVVTAYQAEKRLQQLSARKAQRKATGDLVGWAVVLFLPTCLLIGLFVSVPLLLPVLIGIGTTAALAWVGLVLMRDALRVMFGPLVRLLNR